MLKEIGKNAVKKGETIFKKGDELKQLGIVLSGKVLMIGDCIRMVRPQGSYLALNDMNEEAYTASYLAIEDSVIYALPVTGEDTLRNIIAKSLDYRAIMISSQFKFAVELARIKSSMADGAERLFIFAKRGYEEYLRFSKAFELPATAIGELDELQIYEDVQDINEYRVAYYEEGAKIPLSANKQYFSYSEEMVSFQVNEIISLTASMKDECASLVEYNKRLMDLIALRPHHNLFEYLCVKAVEIKKKDDVPMDLLTLLTEIIEEVGLQHRELQKQVADLPAFDEAALRSRMADIASEKLLMEQKKSKEEREAEIAKDVASLTNSMAQIIKYGAISEADEAALRNNVEYLVKAPDRLSVEDDVRKAKKTITPIVFKLYLSCYRRIKEGLIAPPKAVELFMNFGFLDERLLNPEHLEFLCGIEPEQNEGPCKVVTMMEWLDMIYEGKRENSKNEFDEDYAENLRTLKKQGDINEKQQKALLEDMDKRVEFEIMNMMVNNMRTVYGHPSAYMPILYKEAIYGTLDKLLATKKRINESVQELLKIDYSVFYREVIYSNNDLKIINETVMKNVYPDIILLPLFGLNASMWQEVGGKNKGTPGRFCFPIMTNSNIDDMMVKMLGRFRWELCRCIQGMAWNDVKVRSLTSEYMDYIQFYRKNRDLSDEAREKLKLQIQKGRNNTREIFLIDYENWIKSEANGSMKLNKVARELLATYCPYEKSLRAKLNAQRPYEVAMARGIRNAQKKKQELELKIKAIQKKGEVPEEIMNTYRFYADM